MTTRLPASAEERGRPEWDLLAMKALFRPVRGNVPEGRYQLKLNGAPAMLEVLGGDLRISSGRVSDPIAEIEMDSITGWQLATGSLSVKAAEQRGLLKILGDRESAERMLGCFTLR
jgi:hypothetical protein